MGSNWRNKAHSTKFEVVLSQSKCMYGYLMVNQLLDSFNKANFNKIRKHTNNYIDGKNKKEK